MSKWKLLTEEEAGKNWNEKLVELADYSPFQTFEWGRYHESLGWQPLYCVASDEQGNVSAMALILLKKIFLKTGLAWSPGGPVGALEMFDESLPKEILAETGMKRLYLRFRADRPRRTEDTIRLMHKNWSRPLRRMGTSWSMELDLEGAPEKIEENFKSSWRRQLRLAEKNPLVVKQIVDPDIEELHGAYREMERIKGLPELFSKEKLENLFRIARPNLIVYRCEDESGNLLSMRGVLFTGRKAVEYMGVTNDRGRDLRASFPLEREIIRHCLRTGITSYDLGGIDPLENPGCHRFKRGTGAREVEFLGEWNWATSDWLRFLGDWAIGKRQTMKAPRARKTETEKSLPGLEKIRASFRRLARGVAGL